MGRRVVRNELDCDVAWESLSYLFCLVLSAYFSTETAKLSFTFSDNESVKYWLIKQIILKQKIIFTNFNITQIFVYPLE